MKPMILQNLKQHVLLVMNLEMNKIIDMSMAIDEQDQLLRYINKL